MRMKCDWDMLIECFVCAGPSVCCCTRLCTEPCLSTVPTSNASSSRYLQATITNLQNLLVSSTVRFIPCPFTANQHWLHTSKKNKMVAYNIVSFASITYFHMKSVTLFLHMRCYRVMEWWCFDPRLTPIIDYGWLYWGRDLVDGFFIILAAASSLIRHMLFVDPAKRATVQDICSHWLSIEHT